jgi:hypothetical protein
MAASAFECDSLPEYLDACIRPELRDGERLLWAGQPQPGYFVHQSLLTVLFAIHFTGFAIIWTVAATAFYKDFAGDGGLSSAIVLPLFGLFFVLIGVALFSAPYWQWRRAKRTCYALTDRRAILWEAALFRTVEVRVYGPAELTKLRRVQDIKGRGDLVFEEITTTGHDSEGNRTTTVTRHGFLGIDNVREIEDLLRKTMLAADSL